MGNGCLGTHHSSCISQAWGDSSVQYLAWPYFWPYYRPLENVCRYKEWQEKADVYGVRAYRFFLGVYVFSWGVCFSLGFMLFLSLYVFPWGLSIFLGCIFFLGVNAMSLSVCLSFRLFLWSSRFRYNLILDGRDDMCFANRAQEELWQKYPFPATTTHSSRGILWEAHRGIAIK